MNVDIGDLHEAVRTQPQTPPESTCLLTPVMNLSSQSAPPRLKYHPAAYSFLIMALDRTQRRLGRTPASSPDDEAAHISGQELLEGVRELALEQFGLMARTVFRNWGIRATVDIGHMVFEMVERGEMRKTDRDTLADFSDIYRFEQALDADYRIDLRHAF